MSEFRDADTNGVFAVTGLSTKDIFLKSSTTLVTLGCAAAVALALVGAAYAVDAPKQAVADPAPRGDIVAVEHPDAPENTVTIEEVNLDAGISNLVIVKREPARL